MSNPFPQPDRRGRRPGGAAASAALHWFDSGVKHHLAGEVEAAEEHYRKALELNPEIPEAHNNLGVIIRGSDVPAAHHHFSEAVRLAPTYVEGLVNLGLLLQGMQRLEEARDQFGRAVEIAPQNVHARNNLALVLRELGDNAGAVEHLEVAVRLAPTEPAYPTNLGNAYLELAQTEKAIECYRAALRMAPEYVEAVNNLGAAYRTQRNFVEANRLFRRALELNPDFLDALHNLALAVPPDLETARENEAVLRYAVDRNPESPPHRAALATALQEMGKLDDARAEAEAVLERDPEIVEARNVLAIGAVNDLRFEEALRHCKAVLAREPRNRTARWNRALALLALGDYEQGWEAYESRWDLVHFAVQRRAFPQPRWDGSSLEGKTILLYTEQGLGDGIQFIRFAELLKGRWDVRIAVEADRPLVPLFRTCPWLDDVFPRGQSHPHFDVHAPILSLPGLLGVTLDELSGAAYLEALPRPISSRIEPSETLKVGLVWGGGTPTPTLAWRSLQLELLRPLMEIEAVDFYALQKGDAAAQLESCPFADRIVDLGPELHDFTDTAAAIAELDLVITVDTSVAHLSGALGKPTWILLIRSADWRWMADREGSPWYDSARLFRQPSHGEWKPVVAEIAEALRSVSADLGTLATDARPHRSRAPAIATSETVTRIASAQRDSNGSPRFMIPVEIGECGSPEALEMLQAELGGVGVDPELRYLLDDALRDGDAFLDIGAGWGFSSLSAATLPKRTVTTVALASSDDIGTLKRAARENRLTGSLRVLPVEDEEARRADAVLPAHTVPGGGRLFLHVARGYDVPAAVAGASGWIEDQRVAVVAWHPTSDPRSDDIALPDYIVASSLEALGFEHLRVMVDETGPLLVPWNTPEADGPVFSVSPTFIADEAAAEARAAGQGEQQVASTTAPRLGVDWQIGTNSGWGVYGFNLVRRGLETGRVFPILFTNPDLRSLDAGRLRTLEPALEVHQDLARHAAPGTTFKAPFPVLRALGNRLLGGSAGISVATPANVGVVFFEDTFLDPQALERGRRYDLIIAGSTWNGEVLRGAGLENVEVCLQGIDPGLFAPAAPTGRFGDRFVVFSGGKLEYRKGQDVVVAAFREFHRRHPDSLLVFAWHNHWPQTMAEIVVGGHVEGVPTAAPNGEIDFGGWLERNGLPRGSFHDLGQLPHAEMAAAIREAHVAVFPNRCEGGTNLVAMECLAAGIASILSANTGHLDLIRDGACYPLRQQSAVKPSRQFIGTHGWGESSVEEIVEQLERAYTDREDARRRGAAGADVLRELTWDRQIDRMLDLVDDFLVTT